MLTDNSIEQFFTLPKTAFLSSTAYSEIKPDTRTIRTEIEYNQFLESLLRKYGDETFLKVNGASLFGSSDKMICKSLLD